MQQYISTCCTGIARHTASIYGTTCIGINSRTSNNFDRTARGSDRLVEDHRRIRIERQIPTAQTHPRTRTVNRDPARTGAHRHRARPRLLQPRHVQRLAVQDPNCPRGAVLNVQIPNRRLQSRVCRQRHPSGRLNRQRARRNAVRRTVPILHRTRDNQRHRAIAAPGSRRTFQRREHTIQRDVLSRPRCRQINRRRIACRCRARSTTGRNVGHRNRPVGRVDRHRTTRATRAARIRRTRGHQVTGKIHRPRPTDIDVDRPRDRPRVHRRRRRDRLGRRQIHQRRGVQGNQPTVAHQTVIQINRHRIELQRAGGRQHPIHLRRARATHRLIHARRTKGRAQRHVLRRVDSHRPQRRAPPHDPGERDVPRPRGQRQRIGTRSGSIQILDKDDIAPPPPRCRSSHHRAR